MPDCPCLASPRATPTLLMAQDPMSAPQGHQPLPQQCHSRAGLQLLTALPSHGPQQSWHTSGLVFPAGAQPEPSLIPRDVPNAQGYCSPWCHQAALPCWGCPQCHPLPCHPGAVPSVPSCPAVQGLSPMSPACRATPVSSHGP